MKALKTIYNVIFKSTIKMVVKTTFKDEYDSQYDEVKIKETEVPLFLVVLSIVAVVCGLIWIF